MREFIYNLLMQARQISNDTVRKNIVNEIRKIIADFRKIVNNYNRNINNPNLYVGNPLLPMQILDRINEIVKGYQFNSLQEGLDLDEFSKSLAISLLTRNAFRTSSPFSVRTKTSAPLSISVPSFTPFKG